mmetsp:Transcript_92307/g.275362  ORF Transcript_92307/g.275362 Transcript_92307/m.275362 type:complete len:267 (-) Transcript_92307:283-1083(-)
MRSLCWPSSGPWMSSKRTQAPVASRTPSMCSPSSPMRRGTFCEGISQAREYSISSVPLGNSSAVAERASRVPRSTPGKSASTSPLGASPLESRRPRRARLPESGSPPPSLPDFPPLQPPLPPPFLAPLAFPGLPPSSAKARMAAHSWKSSPSVSFCTHSLIRASADRRPSTAAMTLIIRCPLKLAFSMNTRALQSSRTDWMWEPRGPITAPDILPVIRARSTYSPPARPVKSPSPRCGLRCSCSPHSTMRSTTLSRTEVMAPGSSP